MSSSAWRDGRPDGSGGFAAGLSPDRRADASAAVPMRFRWGVPALLMLCAGCSSLWPDGPSRSLVLPPAPAGGPDHRLFHICSAPSVPMAAAARQTGLDAIADMERLLGLPPAAAAAEVRLLGPGEAPPPELGLSRITLRRHPGVTLRDRAIILIAVGREWDSTSAAVFRHELMHWLLQVHFSVPVRGADQAGREGIRHLSSLPWWLDEGLASACEPGFAGAGPPNAHPARERHFLSQRLAHQDARLARVLRLKPTDSVSAADWNAAWALTFHVLTRMPEDSGCVRLLAYMHACQAATDAAVRSGWCADAALPRGRLASVPDVENAWRQRVGERSWELFQDVFLANQSLEEFGAAVRRSVEACR